MLAVFVAVIAVGFLITNNPGLGVGVFIELLAAAGLVYGAIILQKERNTGARVNDRSPVPPPS